jgi:hypothetical protein
MNQTNNNENDLGVTLIIFWWGWSDLNRRPLPGDKAVLVPTGFSVLQNYFIMSCHDLMLTA